MAKLYTSIDSSKKTSKQEGQVAMVAYDRDRGKPKTSRFSFGMLRNLRDLNPIVNVCVETLKHTIVKLPFSVHVYGDYDTKEYKDEIDFVTNLVENPNPQESFRLFWLKVLEDILVIDRGAIEKINNHKGQVSQYWYVDGATIRPCFDEYGILEDPAYKQYLANELLPSATFSYDELDILMNSPLGSVGMQGYGKSPVERVLLTITTAIQADTFNSQTFSKSSLPPYLLNLKKGTKAQVTALKEAWEGQTMGNMWKGIFMNADDITIQKLRDSNQEMQFYELTLWLSRVIVAAFEMSPQDIGLTMDINKATATVQRELSKNQAIRNLMDIISEWYNQKLIKQLAEQNARFGALCFEFDELDKLDEKTQAEIDAINTNIGKVNPEYLRKRDGIEIEEVDIEVDDDELEARHDELLKSTKVSQLSRWYS